jgi:prophage regulatory protein
MEKQKHDRLLRLREVLQRYPVSKATWYAGIRKGIFPRGVKLSARCTGWYETDIQKLIEQAQGN